MKAEIGGLQTALDRLFSTLGLILGVNFMQDELLVAFDCTLELSDGDGLVGSVGPQYVPGPVEISRVVALEVWDVGAIVGDDGVKAWEDVVVSRGCSVTLYGV